MMAPAARSLDTTRRVELLGAIARGAEPVRAVARERVPERLDRPRLGLHAGRSGAVRGPSGRRGSSGGGTASSSMADDGMAGCAWGSPTGSRNDVIPHSVSPRAGRGSPVQALGRHRRVRRGRRHPALGRRAPASPRAAVEAPWLRATMPAHEPRRSNRITSMRSPRRSRTMSRRPAQRSSPSVVSICAARETKPRRLSVMPTASQTRVPTGSGIAGPAVRGSAAAPPRGRRRPRSAACGCPRVRHRSHHRRREHPQRRDAAVGRPPPRSPPAESPQAPPPPSRRARSADRAASRRRDPRSRRSFRTTRLTDTPGSRTRTRIVRLSASDRNRRPHQPPGASMRPTISRWTSSPP